MIIKKRKNWNLKMLVEKYGEKEKKKKRCDESSQRLTNEEEVKNWRRIWRKGKVTL